MLILSATFLVPCQSYKHSEACDPAGQGVIGTVWLTPGFDGEDAVLQINPPDQTPRPFPGATVLLLKNRKDLIAREDILDSTRTDSLGQYRFAALPGSYRLALQAEYIGAVVVGGFDSVSVESGFVLNESARIEVLHPDRIEKVESVRLDQWFTVSGRGAGVEPPEVITEPLTWADGIENENVRQVFVHIDKHGAITEPEVTKILGSPRAFRRFSLEFDNHVTKLPFRVRIEVAEGGKRYVKEGEEEP